MKQRDASGFTLVEAVIVIAIIGIIAFIVGSLMTTGVRGYVSASGKDEALARARIAIERMSREIRNVRSRADVGTALPAQFCFVDSAGRRISYRFPGVAAGTLVREEPAACPGAAGDVLADGVTGLSFTYLRADGTVDPAPPLNTARVRILVDTAASDASQQLRTEIWPRGL